MGFTIDRMTRQVLDDLLGERLPDLDERPVGFGRMRRLPSPDHVEDGPDVECRNPIGRHLRMKSPGQRFK